MYGHVTARYFADPAASVVRHQVAGGGGGVPLGGEGVVPAVVVFVAAQPARMLAGSRQQGDFDSSQYLLASFVVRLPAKELEDG